MEKYFEINKEGHNIRCKLYYSNKVDVKKAIIYVHGFAGHKDNGQAEKLAEWITSKFKGVSLITFDLPCHGNDVKKKLNMDDCLTYIRLVTEYVKEEYLIDSIFVKATSFGGYLVLRYIHENGNPFNKIVLKSPAINLYDSITTVVIKPDELEKLKAGKNVMVGFDRKVEINPKFITDIKACDIRNFDYLDYADDILILHGTNDEVISYDESLRFAENNVISFVPVEGADHRFVNPKHMEIAIKETVRMCEL